MTIEDESFSIIWQEIRQGMREQAQKTESCASTNEQNGSSSESTQNPMKEVYRTGRSQNIVAHPSLQKIRGRFVGGLHSYNYKDLGDE
jgi:hypothetical protein